MKSVSIAASIIVAILAAFLLSISQFLPDSNSSSSLADRAARILADLDELVSPLFHHTPTARLDTPNKMPEGVEEQKNGGAAEASASREETSRAIQKVFLAIEQSEGAGARVRRSVGTPQLRNLSPFLMLDHFSVKPGAGFPDQYALFPPFLPSPVLCVRSGPNQGEDRPNMVSASG